MASMNASRGETKEAANKWPATVTAVLGTFSVVLSSTILVVALPRLIDDLAVDQGTAQWLITGFLAAMTAAMLMNAWCVDRFGLRTTFLGAMAVFFIGSVLGFFAPGIEGLIAARVLQGAAAGVIQPFGMVVIFRAFAEHERGRGYGFYGLGAIVAPAVSPVLGGLLVDWVSWRATFLVALPACAVGALMGARYLSGRDPDSPSKPLDVVGMALVSLSLTALLGSLALGTRTGWTGFTALGGVTLGGLAFAGFLVRQWFHAAPLLDPRVFRSPALAGGFVLTAAVGAGIYASTYLLPLYLQDVIGLTPSATGALMMPAGLAMAVSFPVAGWLADRAPRWVPVLGGAGSFIVSCVLLALDGPETTMFGLASLILLGRVGLGLILPTATAGAMVGLDRREVSLASGALSFGRQLSAALGVSLISIVLDLGAGVHEERFATLDEMARRVEMMHGYTMAFIVLALGMVAALPALWWRRGGDGDLIPENRSAH